MTLHETWLHSNLAGRDEMAKKYSIAKQYPIQVVDNVLKVDGYDPKEVLEKLTAAEVPKFVSVPEVKKVIKVAKKK